MYVCICNAVTDRQILEGVAQGARCVHDLHARDIPAASCCGACHPMVESVIARALEDGADSAAQPA